MADGYDPSAIQRESYQEVTERQLIAGLEPLILRAHAHGILVCGCTLTPYQGADYSRSEGEVKREAVHHTI
jgi:hypothetical protein